MAVMLFRLDMMFSWLIAFLAQLNPLIGPIVKNALAAHMRRAWSGLTDADNLKYPCETLPELLTCTSLLFTISHRFS